MRIELARINLGFCASGGRIAVVEATRTRFPSRARSNQRNFHTRLRRGGRALREGGREVAEHRSHKYHADKSNTPHSGSSMILGESKIGISREFYVTDDVICKRFL